MSCKDCLHYELCELHCLTSENACKRFFANKAEWVHLPCKVGDTVYCFEPCFYKDYHQRLKIVEEKIVNMKTTATVLGLNFDVDKIGKSVFLTREEAEKALEDMRKEDERK